MDNLFSKVSRLLLPSVKLVLHSSLTQNLIDAKDTILWNDSPLNIDDIVYKQFKDAVKKRGCSFYKLGSTLPYHDFCIALLCCSNYSFNHNTAPAISSRTYVSAWRTMSVISANNPFVSSWLEQYRNGRTNSGYSNALGVVHDNITTPISSPLNRMVPSQLTLDKNMITDCCETGNIIEVSSNPLLLPIHKSTIMPEGQLSDLRVVHIAVNNRF